MPIEPKTDLPAPGSYAPMLFVLAAANRALGDTVDALGERLDAQDGALLANIGHELRTPLSVIQGMSEILIDEIATGSLDQEQHRTFLIEIHRASLTLGKLVETSLLLTKLQAGYIDLHLQPLDLVEAVERVMSQYVTEIEAKAIAVSLPPEHQVPPVWADGTCLELALQALVDNAIKFNHLGGAISWQMSAERHHVQLAITDTGVGIPPERLSTIFTVFGQVESGSTRRWGGLGLGLPLVRRLVESQGGEIKADSGGPQRGATFTLRLQAVANTSGS